jgi:hypothetical protein
MAGVTQEYSLALAPHGILTLMTSNENGVGDLIGEHLIDSISVVSENLSSISITRNIANITKDREGTGKAIVANGIRM